MSVSVTRVWCGFYILQVQTTSVVLTRFLRWEVFQLKYCGDRPCQHPCVTKIIWNIRNTRCAGPVSAEISAIIMLTCCSSTALQVQANTLEAGQLLRYLLISSRGAAHPGWERSQTMLKANSLIRHFPAICCCPRWTPLPGCLHWASHHCARVR